MLTFFAQIYRQLSKANELVGRSFERPAEKLHLNFRVLKRSIREEERHRY
jgi:hypothetical protein